MPDFERRKFYYIIQPKLKNFDQITDIKLKTKHHVYCTYNTYISLLYLHSLYLIYTNYVYESKLSKAYQNCIISQRL